MTHLALPHGEVHIWRASLDQPAWATDRLLAVLTPDEVGRAAALRFDPHRRRFVTARGVLREILGAYLGSDPAGLQLAYTPWGKPYLTWMGGSCSVRFNVSHSGGVALYALMCNHEVGVDIEEVRPVPEADRVARRFFSAPEAELLDRQSASQRDTSFLRAWTCKEALVKAVGAGVYCGLSSFDVSDAWQAGSGSAWVAAEGRIRQWTISQLYAKEGYVAAVCTEGENVGVRSWEWTLSSSTPPVL